MRRRFKTEQSGPLRVSKMNKEVLSVTAVRFPVQILSAEVRLSVSDGEPAVCELRYKPLMVSKIQT